MIASKSEFSSGGSSSPTPTPSSSSYSKSSCSSLSTEEESKSKINSFEFNPLDSLTVAAASVSNYSQEREVEEKASPLTSSSKDKQLSNINNTSPVNSRGTFSLPPISKVFPQHFGQPPTMNSIIKNNYYQQQHHHHHHQNQQLPGYPAPLAPARPPSYLKSPHPSTNQFNPAIHIHPQLNQMLPMIQSKSNPSGKGFSVNYYNSAVGMKPVSHIDHISSTSLDNRKRSYNSQETHSTDIISKSIRSAINPTSNNTNISTISAASTIHARLNFRNFAIQLSSKSTNLTSNQAGTATSDKEHFAAVMQDSVIASSLDFINAFPNYKPTVNNKLKPLKFNEFLREQIYFHYNKSTSGFLSNIPAKEDLVFFYKTPDSLLERNSEISQFKIFRHSRSLGIAIYRKGQRIFPVTPEDIADFWSETPKRTPVVSKERSLNDFKDDDLIMICRGYADSLKDEIDSIAKDASEVPSGGDLDDILPENGHVLDDLRGETGIIMASLGCEFDSHMMKSTNLRIRHVIHVEKSGHTAIDDPWPYAITKHTLVLRPYLALLFSDASKINRFSPTIEFVVKKTKTAPLGEPITKYLRKLSEVQHMVGGLVIGNKLRYWATGGAFLVHLRRESPKSPDWNVSFPGIEVWDCNESSTVPVGEIDVMQGDCILLCCPEIRFSWAQDDLVNIIKSRALWPEKFLLMTNRLKEEKNSKNGLGLYEITLKN